MQETTQTPTESNSARKRRLAKEFNESNKPAQGRYTNEVGPAERAELNALSKEVFGSSSRWQKLVNVGYSRLLTEKVTELVPATEEGKEDTTREVDVPVKRHDGAFQSHIMRHTVESIREHMIQRKTQLDAFRAMLKKQQEEQQAKKEQEELALKVHQELQGSAI